MEPTNLPTNNPEELTETEQLQMYEKPIGEHLQELRKRFLWCFVLVLVAFFVIASYWSEDLVEILSAPVKAQGIQFIYVGLAEALVAQLKVAFIASVVVHQVMLFHSLCEWITLTMWRL